MSSSEASTIALADLPGMVGKHLGHSDWETIDQVAERAFPGATSERKHEIVAEVLAGDWSKLGL